MPSPAQPQIEDPPFVPERYIEAYRIMCLSVIAQAKFDMARIDQQIPRTMKRLRRARYSNRNRYIRLRKALRDAIEEKRDIRRFVTTRWFRDLCRFLGLRPEQTAREILNPSPYRWPGRTGG